MKPKIFVDGEHGTTGLQIHKRLNGRADIDLLTIAMDDRHDREKRSQLLNKADVAILCLPDDAARDAVSMISNPTTRVIDTSTAHRTASGWVYGFAELEKGQSELIAAAPRISNPGCYSTGAIALVRPLTAAEILPADHPVTVNAVSGYSGGGKQLIAKMEDETNPEHIDAPHFLYGTNLKHKHIPEIQKHGLLDRKPLFSPSVGRFARGMMVQFPIHLDTLPGTPDAKSIYAILADHYAGQEVVQVLSPQSEEQFERIFPTSLNDTDRMDLYVFGSEDGRLANLVAVMDNLGKGASGAAVQNLDLMLNGA